jgi:DNA invertase Pin-like site-specific DNA recombinase
MRVAVYARVSTDDRGQDPENQLQELREWCASVGHTVSAEYVDYESGRKGADKRSSLQLCSTTRRSEDSIAYSFGR